MSNSHKNAPLGQRHAVHNWEFANATARTSATYLLTDIGKEVYQQDTKKFWRITDVVEGVATFEPVGLADLSGTESTLGTSDSDHILEGTKNWTTKLALPISTAVQTALNLKLDASGFTATAIKSLLGITTLSGSNTGDQDLSGYELLSHKNAANGYAGLDSGGYLLVSQLPDSILSTLKFKGTFNGSAITSSDLALNGLTAIPTASGANEGYFFISTGAHTSFSTSYITGDWIISIGSSWEKIDNTDAVSSFNGRLGAISLLDTDLRDVLNALTAKTTLVDADTLSVLDSAASNALKKFTLANLWTWMQSKLGSAATKNVGTGSGDVAAGDKGLPSLGANGQVLTVVDGVPAYATPYGLLTINNVTSAYTFTSSDIFNAANNYPLTRINISTANNVTFPSDATLELSTTLGQQIVFGSVGAGQTTVVGSGATVTGSPGNKLRATRSYVTAIRVAANTWDIIGDLSA